MGSSPITLTSCALFDYGSVRVKLRCTVVPSQNKNEFYYEILSEERLMFDEIR